MGSDADESAVKHAHLYAAACRDVLNAGEAVIETANKAVGARNMANMPSQHEISRKNFQTLADELEQEFVPPYKGTFRNLIWAGCWSGGNSCRRA
jgi:hypothetical protein